ncbi:MAG: sigma-70 family RNA polymerase sigma factor [Gammaproteobacteria bacterium]|nr:sigma-70 family RNA polymerase sigma factor [Gammaproteobacteria bacterium]
MNARQHKFEALIGVFHADLFRYAYWLCGDRELAQELVQDTMLRAWRAMDRLRDEAAAKQWLITILRRELARHYGRNRPQTVEADDQLLESPAPGPEDDAEIRVLRQAIAGLEDEYREPITLQVVMGLSVREIAAAMELNQNTVLTRLFRARKKLGEVLSEEPALAGRPAPGGPA